MNLLALFLLTLPGIAGLFLLLNRKLKERAIGLTTHVTVSLYLGATLALIAGWAFYGFSPLEFHWGDLYASGNYHLPLLFYFDKNSAVFLLMTAILGWQIVHYSRVYLHRERGYRRFFSYLLMLMFGMSVILFAGTLDLLFAGWEVLGTSSFLLIGFYWDRTQPVHNAVRTFCIYRVCDLGLLLAAWVMHSSHPIPFSLFDSPESTTAFLQMGLLPLLGVSLLLILSAAGKSAQFPFSFWLQRAMEGPTPSSAIFYGALSIHAGLFLLLRTYGLWHTSSVAPWVVGGMGFITAILASLVGAVQANIKGQIASASLIQVGLQFIEVALGFRDLALFHFASNAAFRCYQLLISPSIIAYRLRLQGSLSTKYTPWPFRWEKWFGLKVGCSLYVLALNEAYVETLLHRLFWQPTAAIGQFLSHWDRRTSVINLTAATFSLLGIAAAFSRIAVGPVQIVIAGLMVLISIRAVVEDKSIQRIWNLVAISSSFPGFVIWIGEPTEVADIAVYTSGVLICWAGGMLALKALLSEEMRSFDLPHRVNAHPVAAFLLLVSSLGMVGFPASPTFLGEDLLLSHAVGPRLWIVFILSTGFLLNGVALARSFLHLPRTRWA